MNYNPTPSPHSSAGTSHITNSQMPTNAWADHKLMYQKLEEQIIEMKKLREEKDKQYELKYQEQRNTNNALSDQIRQLNAAISPYSYGVKTNLLADDITTPTNRRRR